MKSIDTIKGLFQFIEDCSDDPKNLIFRGVKKASYELIPSIGRFETHKNNKFTKKDHYCPVKIERPEGALLLLF